MMKKMTTILGSGKLQAAGAVIDNSTREIISLYAGKNYENLIFTVPFKVHGSQAQPLNH